MFVVPLASRRAASKFLKLLGLLSHPRLRRALIRHGVAAAIEHTAIVQFVKPATLIDVGANIGQFSLLVRAEESNCMIYAFEPHAESAAAYRKAFTADSRALLFQVALASLSGVAILHISGRPDSSSLLPISDEQAAFAPGTQEVTSSPVNVTSLDDAMAARHIFAPSLLKIDVQGGELDVLRGAVQTLQSIDYIYCELSFVELYVGQPLAHEVVDFLGASGFTIRAVHNISSGADGLSVQADFLFRNEANFRA